MQDLDELYQSVVERKENPKPGSYTDYLFTKGLDKILKKSAKSRLKSSLQPRIRTKANCVTKRPIFYII